MSKFPSGSRFGCGGSLPSRLGWRVLGSGVVELSYLLPIFDKEYGSISRLVCRGTTTGNFLLRKECCRQLREGPTRCSTEGEELIFGVFDEEQAGELKAVQGQRVLGGVE